MPRGLLIRCEVAETSLIGCGALISRDCRGIGRAERRVTYLCACFSRCSVLIRARAFSRGFRDGIGACEFAQFLRC